MNDIVGSYETEWHESFDWDRTEDIIAEEVSAKEAYTYLTKEQAEETAHFIRMMGMLISHVMVKQRHEKEQQEAKIIQLNTNEQKKAA